MNLRTLLLAATVATLATLTTDAGAGISLRGDACRLDSDYRIAIKTDHIAFERDGARPTRIEMAKGRLRLDDRTVPLSEADAERLRRFERGVRDLAPDVRALAADAIDLAYGAVGEVALALSDDPAPMLSRLDDARRDLEHRLLGDDERLDIDSTLVETAVEAVIGEFVPLLVGQITATAVAAALSGDETRIRDLEARAKDMEARIEDSVERRAKQLAERADALCARLSRLDELDNALDVRLADGTPLNLLEM